MADDDGIVGEVLDVVGDVAGAVGGELKKFGKSAASQVTGTGSTSAPTTSKQPSAITGGDDAGSGIGGEFKKILQTAGSQVTGHVPTLDAEQLAKMAKNDEEFSTQEAAAVKAKIDQIYQEYAAKRAREEQQRQVQEQQQEQQKQEIATLADKKKQDEMDVVVAQAKAKAEIKNYGAE